MRRDWTYREPRTGDRLICWRFGSGAFPCGPVHKVRLSAQPAVPGGPVHETARAMCEAHYVFDVTKTGFAGGAGGFKMRARAVASERLTAAHAAEFQGLYEVALSELCATTEPPIDPAILLPHREGAAS